MGPFSWVLPFYHTKHCEVTAQLASFPTALRHTPNLNPPLCGAESDNVIWMNCSCQIQALNYSDSVCFGWSCFYSLEWKAMWQTCVSKPQKVQPGKNWQKLELKCNTAGFENKKRWNQFIFNKKTLPGFHPQTLSQCLNSTSAGKMTKTHEKSTSSTAESNGFDLPIFLRRRKQEISS